ncbi:putative membrane protein [Campylobacter iguaniorum]|nr:putative membrane protein [Campylobacter iguaniorum]
MAALFTITLNATVIDNANILSVPVKDKLDTIGLELQTKTGIKFDLITFAKLDGQKLEFLIEPYIKDLSYVVLALVPKELGAKSGKVDIFGSNDALKLFDKEAVLSPYPESGSIIPILVSKKETDIYNAAMLNGYADVADRIASSKGVKLESSIGNSNRDTINILRYLIYGSIILVIVVFMIRKFKR